MTEHYEITKALHNKEYDSIKVCYFCLEDKCDKVSINGVNYIPYSLPEGVAGKLKVQICPEHKNLALRSLEDVFKGGIK